MVMVTLTKEIHSPADDTQWENRDGDSLDRGGDNQSGNNPDVFPDDPTQCKDIDGDGYGDNAAGNNGDAFKFDPTQWSDFDGDGYGDNNGTGSQWRYLSNSSR